MNLKRRLQRLPPPAAHTPVPATPLTGIDVAPSGDVAPVAERSPSPRAATLDDLRERMRQILDRPEQPPTREASKGFDDLGFVPERNAAGQFWRRRERLRPSEHVGRVPVTEAHSADAGVLALLALDDALSERNFGRALFLDTETTGLGSGAGTYAFLVGLCYAREGDYWVDQLLLAGPEQEAAMLRALSELVEDSDVLVSFNGKSFDWPLMQTRYVMNRSAAPKLRGHLDLLHLARRVHGHRLSSCTLKTLEGAVLGFEREGDIDGAEVASRYGHYLRSGDAGEVQQVLDHNYWDVVSMAALVALYGEANPALDRADYVGLARTYRKAKALQQAHAAAEIAVQSGVGAQALVIRGEIRKALADRVAALSDFELAHEELDDPSLRLHMAKLYEHTFKQPERALELLQQGLAETSEASERRRLRLLRKIDKQRSARGAAGRTRGGRGARSRRASRSDGKSAGKRGEGG